MKLTLTLSDQTVIDLSDATYTTKFSTICKTKEEAQKLAKRMLEAIND